VNEGGSRTRTQYVEGHQYVPVWSATANNKNHRHSGRTTNEESPRERRFDWSRIYLGRKEYQPASDPQPKGKDRERKHKRQAPLFNPNLNHVYLSRLFVPLGSTQQIRFSWAGPWAAPDAREKAFLGRNSSSSRFRGAKLPLKGLVGSSVLTRSHGRLVRVFTRGITGAKTATLRVTWTRSPVDVAAGTPRSQRRYDCGTDGER